MPKEKLFPLVDAVHQVTGRRPALSTPLRWCMRRNRNGVRLESWMVGGRRLTSLEAVQRFIDANTAAADRQPASPSSPNRQAADAHEAALRDLEAAGV